MTQKSREYDPTLYDNSGLADYRNERFRLRIALETVTRSKEVVQDIVSVELNPVPLDYGDLQHLVTALWESLYDYANYLQQRIYDAEPAELAILGPSMKLNMDVAYKAGMACETLAEHADSLLIDYNEHGEIINRLPW